MYLSEQLENKWSPVLDHEGLNKIKDPYRRAVTAILLENQETAVKEERRVLSEAPLKLVIDNFPHQIIRKAFLQILHLLFVIALF